MVTYTFEKLYADLVTDDGTVCIVYLTWTSLLGVRQGSAGYELYTPDGRREVGHAIAAPSCPPDLDAPEWTVRFDLPDGPLELHHRVRRGGWVPDGLLPSLHWSVKAACSDAVLRIGDRELRGRGYADWVELGRPPRSLGLARLDWGRAHVGDEVVVWNRVTRADGGAWTGALGVAASIDEAGLPRDVELDGGRVLHEGPALDEARFPSPITRALASLLSPPMHETRWVSRARIAGLPGRGWAVHELVHFGTSP